MLITYKCCTADASDLRNRYCRRRHLQQLLPAVASPAVGARLFATSVRSPGDGAPIVVRSRGRRAGRILPSEMRLSVRTRKMTRKSSHISYFETPQRQPASKQKRASGPHQDQARGRKNRAQPRELDKAGRR